MHWMELLCVDTSLVMSYSRRGGRLDARQTLPFLLRATIRHQLGDELQQKEGGRHVMVSTHHNSGEDPSRVYAILRQGGARMKGLAGRQGGRQRAGSHWRV